MAISEAYNCDCLEYMRTLPDKSFDIAIVDPPYREFNKPTPEMKTLTNNDNLFVSSLFDSDMKAQIERVSKEQVVFGANNFGYSFKGFIVWDKMVRGSDRYSQAEIASLSEGLSTVSTIVQITTYQKEPKIHPTQKPTALYCWLLNTYGGVKLKFSTR